MTEFCKDLKKCYISPQNRLNLCLSHHLVKLTIVAIYKASAFMGFDFANHETFGVTFGHWMFVIFYIPAELIFWQCLRYHIFENNPNKDTKFMVWLNYICNILIGCLIYAEGMHSAANELEILSRKTGVNHGIVYELTYFFDEKFAHFNQKTLETIIMGILFYTDGIRIKTQTYIAFLAVYHGSKQVDQWAESGQLYVIGPHLVVMTFFIFYRYRYVCGRVFATAFQDYFTKFLFLYTLTYSIELAFFSFLQIGMQPSESPMENQYKMYTLSWIMLAANCVILLPIHECIRRRVQTASRTSVQKTELAQINAFEESEESSGH